MGIMLSDEVFYFRSMQQYGSVGNIFLFKEIDKNLLESGFS